MKNSVLCLRELAAPEVTTSMLLGVFSHYQNPQKKIHDLNKQGLVQSIKQGVYLLSPDLGFRPYSKEILANLIYGPSYISLETALSSYGFIPERVSTTTSVCFGRGKSFSTPVGDFVFHHIKEELYPVGVMLREVSPGAYCLYATPEKALLDFVYLKETQGEFKIQKDHFDYILESYRLDLAAIESEVSLKKLQFFAELYPYQHLQWFATELMKRLVK